jgi:hypothetical protein
MPALVPTWSWIRTDLMPTLCRHEQATFNRERTRSHYVESPWSRRVSSGKPDRRTIVLAWRRRGLSRQKPVGSDAEQVSENLDKRFARLARQWREERSAMSSSSVARMAMCPSYQEIIGLGPEAIRPILQELRLRPDPEHWFWALAAITRENPVPPQSRGKTHEMAVAWLRWGTEHGHI